MPIERAGRRRNSGREMVSPSSPGEERPVLDVRDLRVSIPTGHGVVQAADGVSFTLREREVLGIVGETGSGKSVTCRAVLGLRPSQQTSVTGSVTYSQVSDDNILRLRQSQLRRYWGSYASMIPQNPMSSLNPVRRIGDQIAEAVTARADVSRRDRDKRVYDLMNRVGIPAPVRRARDYPHQFSGGMLQRTLIAIALASQPKVLIADEPTTALDVIIQDQILSLLLELQRDLGMSLILVSHDLSVIAQVCDRIGVMYAGQVVEQATTDTLLAEPRHPYTAALLRALPNAVARTEKLQAIPGSPPQLVALPPTCRFQPRCPLREDECSTWPTELLQTDGAHHLSRCRRHGELVGPRPPVETQAGSAPHPRTSGTENTTT